MDLLFHRYASPFLILDAMITNRRFTDFVLEFIKERNDEEMWEVWLHKVFDKSFAEFKDGIVNQAKTRIVGKRQIEATVKNSFNILNGFKPE